MVDERHRWLRDRKRVTPRRTAGPDLVDPWQTSQVVGTAHQPVWPEFAYDLVMLTNNGRLPRVELIPEPNNPQDPKAVLVVVPDLRPEPIGHLAAKRAAEIADHLQRGEPIAAHVDRVIGDDDDPDFVAIDVAYQVPAQRGNSDARDT